MHLRLPHLAVAATAGLGVAAAPAAASEPPVGTPLPAPLQPVTIIMAPPGAPPVLRHVRRRPAVLRARLRPRRVHRGRRTRLHVRLATRGRVRVRIERTVHGRHIRVRTRTVSVRGRRLNLRLRRLRPGHYRVTIVAIDRQGHRSRPVHRSLVVRRH